MTSLNQIIDILEKQCQVLTLGMGELPLETEDLNPLVVESFYYSIKMNQAIRNDILEIKEAILKSAIKDAQELA